MPAPWPGKRKAAMFRRQLWWVSVAPFNDYLPLWGPTSQSYKKVASSRRAECYWPLYGLGERGWTRTIDPCLKRALLCQLSYAPTFFQSNTAAEVSLPPQCGRPSLGLDA